MFIIMFFQIYGQMEQQTGVGLAAQWIIGKKGVFTMNDLLKF